MKLRPYQDEGLTKVAERYKEGVNRQVVKLPTGMGKTPFFASLKKHLGFSGRQFVLLHREELATQAADKLSEWNEGATVGIEMGGSRANDADFVVAGVLTVGNKSGQRLQQFNRDHFNSVTVDECHHSTAASYQNVFRHFGVFDDYTKLLLGVTATVNRSDGAPLKETYQEIVYEKSILEGIKEGWLSDLRGISIHTGESLDGVRSQGGDFVITELADKCNTDKMNDLAVRSWLKHGEDRQTLAFCVDVQHAKDLAHKFKEYGVAFEAVWGNDPYRAEKLAAHRSCALRGLTNCEVLTEGYDDWRIGCIIFDRPTESELFYTQVVGRGTRIPFGVDNLVEARKLGTPLEKEDCIIIDLVNNTTKHSLVTLASLFGLNKDLDVKGKKITEVMAAIAVEKAKQPLLDLSNLLDFGELKSYAQQVDLFQVRFPPETEQLSQNQWRKVNQAYVLLLIGGSSLTVLTDLLGKWHIVGSVGPYNVHEDADSFKDAISAADERLNDLGTRKMVLCARRVLKSDKTAPTPAQLTLCKRLRIAVPPGASFGEVRRKIGQVLAERKKGRAA